MCVRFLAAGTTHSSTRKHCLAASNSEGIRYIHMPEIGGLRRPKHDSINLAWKNMGFRGYADFMQTKEFTENLLKIIALAQENLLALMCAEALPWRCHRSLISDALVVRHIKVQHIISVTSLINHEVSEMAQVEGTKITYPLFTKETPQRNTMRFRNRSSNRFFSLFVVLL